MLQRTTLRLAEAGNAINEYREDFAPIVLLVLKLSGDEMTVPSKNKDPSQG